MENLQAKGEESKKPSVQEIRDFVTRWTHSYIPPAEAAAFYNLVTGDNVKYTTCPTCIPRRRARLSQIANDLERQELLAASEAATKRAAEIKKEAEELTNDKDPIPDNPIGEESWRGTVLDDDKRTSSDKAQTSSQTSPNTKELVQDSPKPKRTRKVRKKPLSK